MLHMLNFELPKLISELKKAKPRKVLVQLPEGIKTKALELAELIEGLGIEVIFSGETAWGGCSIAIDEAKKTGCDLLVHFGHAIFIKSDFPIIYIEVRDELDLVPLLKKSLKTLKPYKTLGLSYSVQHHEDIPKVIEFYKKQGKQVILSQKKGYAAYEGHVVGCEYRGLKAIEEQVDAFLIIGNQFHSMGAVLSVNKPVILLDVYNNDVRSMEHLKDKILKQRLFSIEKLRKAKNVGVIIEIKPGQKFGSHKYLIKKLKEQ